MTECSGTGQLAKYRIEAGNGFAVGVARCPDCGKVVQTFALTRIAGYGSILSHENDASLDHDSLGKALTDSFLNGPNYTP